MEQAVLIEDALQRKLAATNSHLVLLADLLLNRLANPEKARHYSQKALERDPTSGQALLLHTKSLIALEKTEEALSYAKKLQRIPDFSITSFHIQGELYDKLG